MEIGIDSFAAKESHDDADGALWPSCSKDMMNKQRLVFQISQDILSSYQFHQIPGSQRRSYA
jgi:hypothetical protein